MRKLLAIAVVSAVAVAFWLITSLHPVVNFFISTPGDTFAYALQNYESLGTAFFVTLLEAAAGLVLATAFSFLFAIACTMQPALLAPTRAAFVVTQVLPIITLAPLFVAVLGMGLESKVAMVAIMCFFPIFMNLVKGVEHARSVADDFLSMYHTPLRVRLPEVYLPLALPSAFVGLKIAATLAVLGAIVAEFLGAYYGLGKNLYQAPKNANAELMMASAILTAGMGSMIFKLIEIIEKRTLRWE